MKCSYCNRDDETRPYGEKGRLICFKCMRASPEREAEATRQFSAQLAGVASIPVIGTEAGPFPIEHLIKAPPSA